MRLRRRLDEESDSSAGFYLDSCAGESAATGGTGTAPVSGNDKEDLGLVFSPFFAP